MRPWLAGALALLATTGCAAQSCPAVYLSPGVHIDATAWAGGQLAPAALTATVCLGTTCVAAGAITRSNPDDLFAGVALPTGKATVRVKLTAPDGRTLDQTTTADVTLQKPFGSGCGGRNEVDLAVTTAGALVAGLPAKTN
ncbi:hypothetical protein acdb102_10580 [Acidothermaceae bacterium B102]|nr:hypothetical protein acdb102_10580 [Acidothermaceae bacterium B102]